MGRGPGPPSSVSPRSVVSPYPQPQGPGPGAAGADDGDAPEDGRRAPRGRRRGVMPPADAARQPTMSPHNVTSALATPPGAGRCDRGFPHVRRVPPAGEEPTPCTFTPSLSPIGIHGFLRARWFVWMGLGPREWPIMPLSVPRRLGPPPERLMPRVRQCLRASPPPFHSLPVTVPPLLRSPARRSTQPQGPASGWVSPALLVAGEWGGGEVRCFSTRS